MKWSIVFLVALGLFAAISASVLVGALRGLPASASASDSSSKDEVIVAAKPLIAMSAIGPNDISIQNVSKDNLPEGYFSEPVEVIGRILAVSVAQDQILTQTCLVKEGDRARLAAAIPHGMRAITMNFPNTSTTGGLLYPGCIVDILASFRLPSKNRGKGKAISTTLLQGIQVLAVENSSIVSKDDEGEKDKEEASYSGPGGKKLVVTLMVNSRQAEALQLAREYGTVSIVMRNPLDKSPVNSDSTVLNEGKLAKSGSALTPAGLTQDGKIDLLRKVGEHSAQNNLLDELDENSEHLPPEMWNVTVIRGKEVEVQKVDSPDEEDDY
ncbi:MAG: Flp pilus assembly protein CpaB [Sedimentisphaerales bacterium]|nr:Flp pilus assembly protein CpaB [Sedimentisphaerales bacterium]